jgi:hypothetical protein
MKKSLKMLFGSILCFLVVLTNAAIPYWTDALFGVPTGQVFAENDAGNVNYKISGYVEPDFNFDNPDLKSGFLVELVGYEKSVLSDSRGYFEIKDVPSNSSGYTVKISKANYLYRQIEDVELTCNIQLGTEKEPIKMWAGDIQIDGIQDNAINIVDIMQVISCFNTTPEYEDYNADLDINKNGAINLEDIMIVVGHFNTTPLDYPSVPVTKENDREFIFRIKTTSEGEVYQFPIKSSEENYNIVVDWGDGTTSEITGYSTREHKYESAGTYTIKVISFDYMPLYFNSDKKLIEVVTPFPDIGATDFSGCFYNCVSLTEIPEGLFDNNINATSFYGCFGYCTGLTEIPEGLFDNNINATSFGDCFAYCTGLTEIPEGLFDNNINVTDFYGCFSFCTDLTEIPDGLFDNNINVKYFFGCFMDCTGLTKIPERLFDNNINATDFGSCFSGCKNLTKIPEGLFDNNINVTNFSYCFYGCKNLTKIPEGLFDNNINATSFYSCFYGCKNLTKIPEGLFDNNINVTNFSYCFYGCENLTKIPEGLFYNNINATDFSYCFRACVRLTGLAPNLWTRSNVYGYSCFYRCTNLSNYADIPDSWK